MTDEPADLPADEREQEAAVVDLDLDAEDALLREALGQPLTVRVGGKVISVPHPNAWPHAANEAAGRAEYSTWARGVLSGDDCNTFLAAELRNYQVQAIFKHVNKKSQTDPGKSPASRGSSKATRKR